MKDPQKLNRREAVQAAMGVAGLAALAAPAAQAASTVAMAMPANPVVETASGKVRGYSTRGVAVFRGIPYGASTTGENRFLPPAKPEPWPGVRNCLAYGHSCPEANTGPIENDKARRSTDEDAFLLYRTNAWTRGEDCLRLNVWTPSASSARKRPVMVYMHGGGYTGGSGNDLLSYDGENLARQLVILALANVRVDPVHKPI